MAAAFLAPPSEKAYSGLVKKPRRPHVAAALLVLLFVAPRYGAAQARIEFHDGVVSLSATNTPIQEILQAWERVGGVKVLFGDRLRNVPVTLNLDGVPEAQALDELLADRSAGYLARERPAAAGGKSRFALLMVLAESDIHDGGAAARRTMAEATRANMWAGQGERIIDYRALPPRDPNDPNGPVGLTPASPGDIEPPPLAFPPELADQMKASGLEPGVNPIPLGIAPPPPPVLTPGSLSPNQPLPPPARGGGQTPPPQQSSVKQQQ